MLKEKTKNEENSIDRQLTNMLSIDILEYIDQNPDTDTVYFLIKKHFYSLNF